MKVYLVGYMGSGKSTLGRQLSARMGLPFIDLDKSIEAGEGKEIFDIFDQEGEAAFRGLERKYLRKLSGEAEDFVMAVGGGTPCFYDNMQYMNAEGITVYLQMDAGSLAYRLFNGKGKRPLVMNKSEQELKEFVKTHLAEREDMYKDAGVIVQALGFNAKKLDELEAKLRTYSR